MQTLREYLNEINRRRGMYGQARLDAAVNAAEIRRHLKAAMQPSALYEETGGNQINMKRRWDFYRRALADLNSMPEHTG